MVCNLIISPQNERKPKQVLDSVSIVLKINGSKRFINYSTVLEKRKIFNNTQPGTAEKYKGRFSIND